jgi:hypothetical protein
MYTITVNTIAEQSTMSILNRILLCVTVAQLGLVALAQGVYATASTLPQFPLNWYGTIEANFAPKNYSMHIQEFYDYANGRVRIDMHSNDKQRTMIEDVTNNRRYVILRPSNPGGKVECNATAAVVPGVPSRVTDRSGHLMKSADMFEATRFLKYKYLGQRWTRGIYCNVWSAEGTGFPGAGAGRPRPPGFAMRYTLEWHWATPEWRVRGEASHDIPVRAHLRGEELMHDVVTKNFGK